MLCTQQQHSDLRAGSTLSPSDGCLLGTFPFDFVLEHGGPQLCPALSRSPGTSSSAQSLLCVVWVRGRALGPLPFLYAIMYLPNLCCTSQRTFHLHPVRTSSSYRVGKQDLPRPHGDKKKSLQAPLTSSFFEQLFRLWARQRVTKTVWK